MLLMLISAATACEPDTSVQHVWPSWGPVNTSGLIRVGTGGDDATLQIIDSQGGAWPVSGGPSIEYAPGEWFSFKWPSAIPDGMATLIAEPGTVQLEVEVQACLASVPPDGNPRLGEVLFDVGPWATEVCDTDGPSLVIATAEVVLPAAHSGGFVAEILLDGQVLDWVELPESRSPVTIEAAWAPGEREELCLSVNVFDPSHFVSSQHALDCEPVPEEFLAPTPTDSDCGCTSGSTPIGMVSLFGLLALGLRRR